MERDPAFAKALIEEHERMVLTGADNEAFIEALRHPPAPAKRLVSALARQRALLGQK